MKASQLVQASRGKSVFDRLSCDLVAPIVSEVPFETRCALPQVCKLWSSSMVTHPKTVWKSGLEISKSKVPQFCKLG
ncbi:hypothetical protein WJX84_007230 [Apatococcus fuscideae]|uniref:Uncharacterized protein n=1 Tax=Apatococcus fuscideae TaxID=2026836 RepID=A0AAW1SWV7_9CHLO